MFGGEDDVLETEGQGGDLHLDVDWRSKEVRVVLVMRASSRIL